MYLVRRVRTAAVYVQLLPRLLWLFAFVVSMCFHRYDDARLLTALAVWAIVTTRLFSRLVNAVKDGDPFRAASSVWWASPIPLSILVVFGEHRAFTSLFELDKMPVSLIIGDTIVLPAAAAIAAWSVRMSWSFVDLTPSVIKKPDVTSSPITGWICLLIGLAAGISFHVWDAGNYAADHLDALVGSISKMWHDLVTYTALFGGLLYAFLTIIMKAKQYRWRFVTGFVSCILLWLCLGIYDGSRGLDARNFHSPCNLQCGADNLTNGLADLLNNLGVDVLVHDTLDLVRSVLEYFMIM